MAKKRHEGRPLVEPSGRAQVAPACVDRLDSGTLGRKAPRIHAHATSRKGRCANSPCSWRALLFTRWGRPPPSQVVRGPSREALGAFRTPPRLPLQIQECESESSNASPKASPKPRSLSSNEARSFPKMSNSSSCDNRLPSVKSKNDGAKAASAVSFCMQAFFNCNPVLNTPKTPIEAPAASAAQAASPTGPSPRKATPTQAGTARLMNLVAKEKAVSMAKMSTAHFVFSFVPPPTCFSGVHHFVADLMMSPARMRNVAPCPVAIQQFTRLV
mmetsp:Transcript_30758/g.87802  ORF Transcript_30758/g.87802 Transcript_30758/m.87802 type:complete len:272 (+) Transcript_30758:146-961(+)